MVDKSVTPVNMPIHRRPIAKCSKEKDTLDRYVSQGILACMEELTLAEHLPNLARAWVFSVVDAKEGFLQCPLDETSSYLTIITLGLFAGTKTLL